MATVQPGAVVGGRYQLDRPIGSDGMAKVWLAHDRLLDRQVAVKILAERYASDPDFVERFRREASAAAGLSHPNIVTVYDRGETDGSYYIVMEHLPGPDLKAILRQRGKLDPRQAVDAALQVLAAVSAAHRREVIHRDIKPQNVLVAEDGHLKVTDFGIARAGDDAGMTEVGSVIGTAQYLSPEQARGEEVTPASDCYSVGILLYEMLTGRVPFDGEKPVAVAMRQINDAPVAPRVIVPTLPPQLNDIVMKALEKRPGNRFRTAEEFTNALLAVRPMLPAPVEDATQVLAAVDQPTTTTRVLPPPRQPSGPTRVPPPPPRRRWAPIVAAIIAVLVLAGGAYTYFFTDLVNSEKVEVPPVENRPEAEATNLLRAQGLKPVSRPESSGEVQQGLATRTDPPAGTKVDKGGRITLFVSSGRQSVTVPRVIGRSQEDAKALLKDFVPKVTEEFSDTVEKGNVIRQNPLPGNPALQGSDVAIVVSKGPAPVTVPSLALRSRREAEQMLKDAGLELGNVSERETTKRDPGLVVDQDPPAGEKVDKGSSVDIVISKAPATIAMPDVIGNQADAARAKLQANGLPDPTAETQASDQPAGTVIGQDPPPGRQVDPANTRVVIVVSDGSLATGTTP